jgi:putative NADH-flavin reductase
MSRIVVIGGTGFAGGSIVKEAARRGHHVVALSRSLPAEPVPGVRYEQGSAQDAGPLIAEADVVVAALSPRGTNAGTLLELYTTLAAEAATAGARFIAIGGFSSLRPAPGAPRFAEGNDVPPQYVAEAREMNAVREALEHSPASADWLFVSPAAAYGAYEPQGEPRGVYRTGGDVALFDERGRSAISGADFALAVVDEIEQRRHHRTQIHFAY